MDLNSPQYKEAVENLWRLDRKNVAITQRLENVKSALKEKKTPKLTSNLTSSQKYPVIIDEYRNKILWSKQSALEEEKCRKYSTGSFPNYEILKSCLKSRRDIPVVDTYFRSNDGNSALTSFHSNYIRSSQAFQLVKVIFLFNSWYFYHEIDFINRALT